MVIFERITQTFNELESPGVKRVDVILPQPELLEISGKDEILGYEKTS